MAQPVADLERPTQRTVILLRPSDKRKLERMASRAKISSAEVIRRFIRQGDALLRNQQEEEAIELALKLISVAVSEANQSMTRTIGKLDQLHTELAERNNP
jgi:hypothetical protein